MSEITLCFICDENYVMPASVAITSVMENRAPEDHYEIFVVGSGLTRESIAMLSSFVSEQCDVKIIEVDSDKYNGLRRDGFPVSPVVHFKFDLPNILPKRIEKVLYLDCDVIVQHDLRTVYDTDVRGVYAGVVKDFHGETFPKDFRERLNVNHSAYFNAGVMLLNLQRLREENMPEKLLDYRIKHDGHFMEQDAFNTVFAEKVRYLPFFDNFQLATWRAHNEQALSDDYKIVTVNDKHEWIKSAVVLHFTAEKPWDYFDCHCSEIWLYYYLKSPYKNVMLERRSITSYPVADQNLPKYRQNRFVCAQDYNFLRSGMTPAVSVIMPVYNSEAFVHWALNSLRRQSLVDFEAICVDDGSTDQTLSVLQNYAAADRRFRIVHSDRNRGAGVSRNTALSLARGEYIVFLDADDELCPNALETFYLKGIFTQADFIVCPTSSDGHAAVSSLRTAYLPPQDVFSPDEAAGVLFNITHGGPGGKCVKRSLIETRQLSYLGLRRSEDFYFIYNVMVCSSRITSVRTPLYEYHAERNPQSLEYTKDETPLAFWDGIQAWKRTLVRWKVYEKFKPSFINSNVTRCWYNIAALSKKYDSGILGVKKLFLRSGVQEKILRELELKKHDESYFFVPEYSQLMHFLDRSVDDYIFELSAQKDRLIASQKQGLSAQREASARQLAELKNAGKRS